jgi:hypothetical protein
MHTDIATRRRVLLLTYQRYLAADRTWNIALRDLNAWFPLAGKRGLSVLGNPGSPIRRIHDQRDRAMRQLEAARKKLEVAKRRMVERHQKTHAKRILCITYDGY